MGAVRDNGCESCDSGDRSRVRAVVLDAVGAGARRRRQFSRAAARSRPTRRLSRAGARPTTPSAAFCHGPDLRGGERGGSNLLRSTLVLNDREGESIQPAFKGRTRIALSPAGSDARRRESAGRLHSQRACAGARTGRASSRTGCRAQGARRRCRGRRAVFRHEVRELSLGDGRSQRHWRTGSRTCSASESLDCRRTRRGRRPRWTRCGPCCSGSADDHAA